MMNKRRLGNTGIDVSEIAFGCVEIGLPYGIGVENESQMPSANEAVSLLQTAVERGINFFDTARQYGRSEHVLGLAFQGIRDKVVIATKCRHIRNQQRQIPSDDQIETLINQSFQESLDALQTDYVDVFMLHDGDMEVMQHPVVISVFRKLRDEGKIRASGVSTYLPGETKMAIESGNWNLIQVPFNLLDQRQSAYFDLAHSNGVAIIVRSVLMKGLLSGRGKNLHPALAGVEAHIKKYDTLTQFTGKNFPDLATQFALSFPQVSSVLVGIDKLQYLEEALSVADGHYFDDDVLKMARQLQYPQPDFLNLHTWDLKGWLK
jgi:aryl-alcohol dehydrogenase-like predicted oxidoreductase